MYGTWFNKTRVPDLYNKLGCWYQGKSDLIKIYLRKTDYKESGDMGKVSKIELTITHFYINPNFVLAIWKDLAHVCTGTENNVESMGHGVVFPKGRIKLQYPAPPPIHTLILKRPIFHKLRIFSH